MHPNWLSIIQPPSVCPGREKVSRFQELPLPFQLKNQYIPGVRVAVTLHCSSYPNPPPTSTEMSIQIRPHNISPNFRPNLTRINIMLRLPRI